ncbi:carboxylesterase family protein [Pseudonocardia nematodicida]|uniref:Carboxylic ester hydrolase n=1 Tax=Pseudonocardia nematodicida TaxID=1206997 RepID=A0ABV1KBF1_9PSEU
MTAHPDARSPVAPHSRTRADPPAGPVLGTTVEHGVRRFLGIPYAEPPVGDRRFRPPHFHPRWTEPRDASRHGATAPQAAPVGPLANTIPTLRTPGDDHLVLNVWSPPDGERLPVMVFVHGGSFTSGSGSIGGYDGTSFARDGVVLVTINYRLGAEGFAWFGDGEANLGLRDQIAALEWVRDNIGAFGGNPDAVTVFGESAGGMSIGALLAMSAARGLFRRAIMQSGSTFHAVDAATARLVARRLAGGLGVAPSHEGLAGVPVSDVVEAQTRMEAAVFARPFRRLWGDVATNLMPFEPVVDGVTLPQRPLAALQAGCADDVELMVGWNAEEARLFLPAVGPTGTRRWVLPLAAAHTGLPPLRGARAYLDAYGREPGAALAGMVGDWLYRVPALRTAAAHPRTHVYEFGWPSPAFDGRLGACHAVELPFVFDNLDHPDWLPLVGESPPPDLAAEVHAAWIAFARTGDPGWAAHSAAAPVIGRFGDVVAPSGHLGIWDGRREGHGTAARSGRRPVR